MPARNCGGQRFSRREKAFGLMNSKSQKASRSGMKNRFFGEVRFRRSATESNDVCGDGFVIHRDVASKKTHFILAAMEARWRQAADRQEGRPQLAEKVQRTNERTNERTGDSLLPQPHHRCPSGPSPALPSSPNRFPTKLFRRLWVLLQHWSLLSLSLFRFNYGGLAPRCCRLCFRIRSRGQSRCGYTRIP